MVFFVRNYPWTSGMSYRVVLLEGVATADQYCGMENPAYWSNTFWPFTIWNPSLSSTTKSSTTTSTATIHTVTTRPLGTKTYNTFYTTTGIPAHITTSTTLTSSTSATTTTTTSATSTTTTTKYIPNTDVLYPKDMEQQCVQLVTIATALVTCAIIPLHLYGMINLFVKMISYLQKKKL